MPSSTGFVFVALLVAGAAADAAVASQGSAEECSSNQVTDSTCDDFTEVVLLQTGVDLKRDSLPEAILQTGSEAVHSKHHQGQEPEDAAATPEPEGAAAEAAGITMNAAGDMAAFMSALVLNVGMVCFCVGVFMVLRRRYPMTYSNNVRMGEAPLTPAKNADGSDTYFGWIAASRSATIDEAAQSIGLDNAMMIEYCNLCMKIMAVFGVPNILIMGPLHWLCGGNAAGDDRLSYLSMGNVIDGSWLYYVHAFVVLCCVIICKYYIFQTMAIFQDRRFQWLLSMPEPRANTIFVEGIPDKCRSDKDLKDYFVEVFDSRSVVDATVLKYAPELESSVAALNIAKKSSVESKATWEKAGSKPDARPTVYDYTTRTHTDAMKYYEKEISDLEMKIKEEQSNVLKEAAAPGSEINCASGFVRFKERKDKEVALSLSFSSDLDQWNVSDPPPAEDLIWKSLKGGLIGSVGNFLAYAAVIGLCIAYMPLVVWITNIANSINMGFLQPIWAGFAPTLGLLVMVSFMPTFLILIFRSCYSLTADAHAQHKLQVWYFWFQVIFVLLVTAIGSSVVEFAQQIANDPFSIFSLLAETMPHATHFYMNFMVLQWTTHAMNMMRYVMLGKWFMFKQLYDDETARKMSEPEDQDYYGIGSRAARWSINMLIGIIFSTLSPPVAILTLINFLLSRLFYGYLIVFAETRKPDLGGVFFVKMLEQLFVGMIIYCIVMIGVLSGRSATWAPMALTIPSLLFCIHALMRFKTSFAWETLPFDALLESGKKSLGTPWKRQPAGLDYVQPELRPQLPSA